jgi:hypothetical protein
LSAFIDLLRVEKVIFAVGMETRNVLNVLFSTWKILFGMVGTGVLHPVINLLVNKPFFPCVERFAVSFGALMRCACVWLKVLYQM